VIVDEADAGIYKNLTSREIPLRHAIGGASSARSPSSPSRAAAGGVQQGASMIVSFTKPARRPRVCDMGRSREKQEAARVTADGRTDTRGIGRGGAYDGDADWFCSNNRLIRPVGQGLRPELHWGIGRHGQKQAGAIMPT